MQWRAANFLGPQGRARTARAPRPPRLPPPPAPRRPPPRTPCRHSGPAPRGRLPPAAACCVLGPPFDEAELADVARERRLRDVEAGRAHAATQLLLAAHRRALNDVENDRLAPRFHGFSIHQTLD